MKSKRNNRCGYPTVRKHTVLPQGYINIIAIITLLGKISLDAHKFLEVCNFFVRVTHCQLQLKIPMDVYRTGKNRKSLLEQLHRVLFSTSSGATSTPGGNIIDFSVFVSCSFSQPN